MQILIVDCGVSTIFGSNKISFVPNVNLLTKESHKWAKASTIEAHVSVKESKLFALL